jgi:hypothetical protein
VGNHCFLGCFRARLGHVGAMECQNDFPGVPAVSGQLDGILVDA